ncbi:MAG TPA: Asp/Glu/hydantoin racemase [Synergistaceae bacterium]|jgi:allantoin racemase|nr:Asp/Glu/hydantoin racemase [Synergistaceae bacterium]
MTPRILIINPNSSAEMTRAIHDSAVAFAGDTMEVVTVPTPGASPFIATYEDHAQAAPGMVRLLTENRDRYDAFVIACHGDPNMDLMKEITDKPVVGIGEASMKLATMLGHSFSVIAPVERTVPNKKALIDKYGITRDLASVRPASVEAGGSDVERLIAAGKRAVEEDMAEVLVLGCAGFAGLDKKMEEVLHVPVLDGVICALIVASGLARYGVSISKKRRYDNTFGKRGK